MKKYLAILIALGLSSCGVKLLIQTDPEFATIYEGGRNYGKAPVELSYEITKSDKERGYIKTDTITARWLSGATTKEVIKINYNDGEYQGYTLIRPSDYPNVEIDANYVQERTKKQLELKIK
jgi:hypothetical protein